METESKGPGVPIFCSNFLTNKDSAFGLNSLSSTSLPSDVSSSAAGSKYYIRSLSICLRTGSVQNGPSHGSEEIHFRIMLQFPLTIT